MQVRWTEYAAGQLDEIVDALLDRSPELAQRVTGRILDQVGALADLYCLGRIRRGGWRPIRRSGASSWTS